MRLSGSRVAQHIDSDPPKVVIIADDTGEEITLVREEVMYLLTALSYFARAMGITRAEVDSAIAVPRQDDSDLY